MNCLKMLLKIAAAGFTAVVLLSLILIPYDSQSIHITNKRGNTDYVWRANSAWFTMQEGISHGRVDANGYNNPAVVENPDVIILGSSHMEAMNVMPDENAAYLLGQMLNGKKTVYNMGISGHTLMKICHYLPRNLELYHPQYAVLETSSVDFTQKNVQDMLAGNVPFTASHEKGIIAMAQRLSFLRLLYHQIDSGLLELFMPELKRESDKTADSVQASAKQPDSYELLMDYLSELEKSYGTQIIFLYQPILKIDSNGIAERQNADQCAMLASSAAEHGVTFVDMTDEFERMYCEDYHLPHGFSNTSLGRGHLNRYGHKAIADALYAQITAMEE